MSPLTPISVAALFAVCLLASAAGTQTGLPSASNDVFSDYVQLNGEKIEVADPLGDPNESNSVQQDSTAEWQTEMVAGLLNQRKAEKDFIAKLEIGGKTLNAMVNNITTAFNSLEAARQAKGAQLIKAHFKNELALLQKSQAKVLADLSALLGAQSSDSAELKSLKSKVQSLIQGNFKQQVIDENALFAKQINQIKEEHAKQITHVKSLFSLINNWKDTFHAGLAKSEKDLEQIMESWDLL
ncbi:hypothetical protein ONE63_000692 [Megalurothrips usitatus]|uniref:Uncharacterized protein n=1 Tax=Megalurothrips usitatus TaxID=439358 RepID=A0AAV7XZ92_9NEOP|nr:hypothetical protein ONE63_000692 [Megalurothrips usitatus]